jgi:hypothetical protein
MFTVGLFIFVKVIRSFMKLGLAVSCDEAE